MTSFKEIVTKAVVGKSKKQSIDNFSVETQNVPDTVLGCWVINHNFSGANNNNDVLINGSYDVNVWYSYDNNTKTEVATKTYNYTDKIGVNTKGDTNATDTIVRSLKQPTVDDVKVENGKVNINVSKEMAVEVVGDTKIKVSTEELEDDYDVIDDNDLTDEVIEQIDEDYLNKKEV